MKVEKTTTGVIIYDPTKEMKRKILQYFSLRDPVREFFIYSGNDTSSKPLFGKEHDVIYVTSGILKINDPELQKMLRGYKTLAVPTPQSIDIEMTMKPRSRFQEDCIKAMMTCPNPKMTIEAKGGLGKMEPYYRKIPAPVPAGFIRMGDIHVGDKVFDRHGNPTTVLQIFEHGVQDVYEITFEDGRTAVCGLDHLWSVYINRSCTLKTLTTSDLIKKLEKKNRISIPVCDPVKFPERDKPSCFTHSTNDILYRFVNNSPEVMQQFLNREHVGDSGKLYIPNTLLLGEHYANNVVLPILYAMGYIASYDESTHEITYRKPVQFEGLKITSIKYKEQTMCRCIMVDNDEHLYLTEDFIVTHNTFMASYAIANMHLKPLIIAPTANLKNQWIENFEQFGIPRSDIAANIHDGKNKKLTVVTIASLGNEIRTDWQKLMKSIEDARYGIKVIDEAHLALKAVMRFDAICNIKHNWYLSATLGRSSLEEDDMLNRMYLDSERFIGDSRYEEYQKEYINIYLQDIYYYPSRALCEKYLKFGTKGLIKASYYNMLMNYKNGQPFLNNVLRMMKIARKTETYEGRILVLLPMLDIIDTVVSLMKQDPFFNGAKIGVINGKMPMRERRDSMECDYILSTSASAGTGVDFKNLGCVVNFDQAASLIITEQIVVRLRDRGKECWYFDVRDVVKYARSFEHWGRNRRMVLSYIPGVHPDLKKLPDIRC